jgi:benzodiazapine receptor
MRRLRKGPLFVAVAACGLFAVLGGALVGESIGSWYAGLEKPWFLVPLRVFYLVGVLYYILFAVVLYRVLVHVENHRGRMMCLALVFSVMLFNELWNYGFFGLRSTLAGFLGIVVFLVPLTTLIVVLFRHERRSGQVLVPYYLWVVYDLAWTLELWRLNGGI